MKDSEKRGLDVKGKSEERQNGIKCYEVVASGNTYPVRDELQWCGFMWKPKERHWVNESALEYEKASFQKYVLSERWKGVNLKFREVENLFTRSDIILL